MVCLKCGNTELELDENDNFVCLVCGWCEQ